MEDTDLTKKAIAELLREMDDYKEKESLPTERKKNPLGRPNKRFLGRTINSMLTHNKRQSDRNHQRCQRKLQEMDARQRKRDFRNHHRRHSKSESSHEIISSDSDVKTQSYKKTKKLKKKKKKRRKKKQKSSSSSANTSTSSSDSSSSGSSETESSTSTNSSQQSRSKNRKKKKHKKPVKEDLYEEDYDEYYNQPAAGYYVDPNMAYAAMAYNQMNHIMQQQQMVQHQMVKEELEEDNIEIPSDLSLSCHSESSLNISLNSSSAEEDENGILTFKLESSEDEAKTNIKKTNKKVLERTKNEKNHIEIEDSDKESVHSHISLESAASVRSAAKEENSEICLLSSSDSEDLDIMEVITENTNENLAEDINFTEKHIKEQGETNLAEKPVEKQEKINFTEETVEKKEETNLTEKPVGNQEEINLVEKPVEKQEEINEVVKENMENTNDIPNETDNIDEPKSNAEENVKIPIDNVKTIDVAMVDLTDD